MMNNIKKFLRTAVSDGIITAFRRSLNFIFSKIKNIQTQYGTVRLLSKGYIVRQEGDYPYITDIIGQKKKFYLVDRYTYTEFFSDRNKRIYEKELTKLESEDIVLNIGAHIGTTSVYPAKKAKKIYAVEPSPRALPVLKKNTKQYNNIYILPYAVWNQTKEIKLQFGKNPNKDALITPNDGGINESNTVQAYTISDICDNIDEEVTFLKVEAEGAEPEVLTGLNDTLIDKIVVKVDAERYGKSPKEKVLEILRQRGYETESSGNYVYAIHKKARSS